MSGLGFADPATLTNCTPANCPIDTSFYNYRISLVANIAFLIVFSIELVVFLAIWLFTRRSHFFTAVMLLGCLTEILGYAARIWSYYNQWEQDPFLMQIICLSLAPAFFSAGIYVCLAKIIEVYGRENSLLQPLWYTYIFVPCDILALVLQAAGGGLSASALIDQDFNSFSVGNDLLTAGLAWQVFTLFCFLLLCLEFALRTRRRARRLGTAASQSQEPRAVATRKSLLFRGFLVALGSAIILIFWRCVYRLVELNDGFTGPVTYKQGLFIGFEGVLVVVAVAALAVMHPTICVVEPMAK